MRAVCDGAIWAGKSRPALLGSRTALCKMQTETTLLLYKFRLFGQNERRKLTFRERIRKKTKNKKQKQNKKRKEKARWSYDKMLIH